MSARENSVSSGTSWRTAASIALGSIPSSARISAAAIQTSFYVVYLRDTGMIGTVIGVLVAWRRGSWLDNLLPVTTFFQAAPYFFLAFLAIKRSVFAGVLVGEAVLLAGGFAGLFLLLGGRLLTAYLGAQFAGRLLTRFAGPELESRLLQMALEDLPQLTPERMEGLRAAYAATEEPIAVTSAFPLDEARRRELQAQCAKLLGPSRAAWDFRQDPALGAGLRVRIGPWVLRANLQDELAFFTEMSDGAD